MVQSSFFDNLQFVKRYSAHTIRAYKADLEQFAEYLKSDYEIESPSEVSQPIVRSWLASLIDSDLSHRTVNRKLSSIKAYFNFLVREGHLKTNVAVRVHSLKIPQNLPVSASKNEMRNVLDPGSDDLNFTQRRDLLIIELLYSTGIRLSELINLKISDVDRSLMSIKVTGKGNKTRLVPLGIKAAEAIKRYLPHRNLWVEQMDSALFISEK